MKKRISTLIFLVLIVRLYSQNFYIDNESGIKFIIPDQCNLYSKELRFKKNIFLIREISSYEEMGYTKDSNLMKDLIDKFNNRTVKKIPGGSFSFLEYKEINNIICGIDLSLGSSFDDGEVIKRITFIKNNKLISILLMYLYEPPKDANDKTNLNYKLSTLIYSKTEDKVNKDINDLIKLGKKMEYDVPKELITLYKLFDELVTSIKFLDSKPITYKSSVDNFRFRETPNLKGKFIRSLTKGEKLELIETGKSESINGVKGNWLKVKTEKGEIGWCFDAYLEEVKKN